MKNLFLPYELAVIAKEKGFDEPCLAWYCRDILLPIGQQVTNESIDFRSANNTNTSKPINGGGISAPLYQQVVDWFMTEHKLQILWSSDKEKLNARIKEHFTLIN